MNEPTDRFRTLYEKVANDLVYANIHFKLFLDLNDSFRHYQREVNRSPVFWGIACDSIKDSAILTLCRVYDQKKGANSLRELLKKIERDPEYIDDNLLRSDQDFVSSRTNPVVRRLTIWRNKVMAHSDSMIAAGQHLQPEDVPKYDDLKELLKRGLEIINNYSGWYWGKSHVAELFVGHDDFRFVLDSVKRQLDVEYAGLRAEAKEYGIETDNFLG